MFQLAQYVPGSPLNEVLCYAFQTYQPTVPVLEAFFKGGQIISLRLKVLRFLT
jgi:hypothetical protein